MPLAVRAEPLAHERGFALWRVVVWLLLLLAAFGCLQYFSHAQLLWNQRQVLASDAAASAALRGMLAWDIAYVVAAFALIAVCAGCILRQTWARPALRVAAALVALWMLASGVTLLLQWPGFERASTEALAQLRHDAALRQALLHARRNYVAALVLKAVAVPVLLWLSWRLGVPAVRAQFRHRR
ncbi:MAG TPA: hypothetical protein VFE77_12430 [Rhodanobacter sp.]|nr:hypothetical protein [Rhodanobacter sp.]